MPGMRESGWLQAYVRALEHSQTFIAAICRKLSVAQTSLNSLRISSTPRKLNCLNPITRLIKALGGSTMALRLRHLAQPTALSSFAALAPQGHDHISGRHAQLCQHRLAAVARVSHWTGGVLSGITPDRLQHAGQLTTVGRIA